MIDNVDERVEDHRKENPHIRLTIVSAHYRPSEGASPCVEHPSKTGGSDKRNAANQLSRFSRDVTPYLRALLLVQQYRETSRWPFENVGSSQGNDPLVPVVPSQIMSGKLSAMNDDGMKRTQIRVFGGGMNSVFGDPCPGISKRLFVDYMISEEEVRTSFDSATARLDSPTGTGSKRARAATAEVHHMVFAEHEPIVLRRHLNFYRNNPEVSTQLDDAPTAESSEPESIEPKPESMKHRCLPALVFEILLPLSLPFLKVKERVRCQLICKSWRSIVRQWGIATTIDCQDASFSAFTRPLLRGLVSHSFSSLHSLFLGGMRDLEKSDLHPSIPHLKLLRCLDVSFCRNLDDETLLLLALHTKTTLKILYIKGLRQVSDAGFSELCRGCSQLQVLELSFVPISDTAGIQIGRYLLQLKALYMRDNYRLTNDSINLITSNCTHLEQLTLWGCTRLNRLHAFDAKSSSASQRLVMLNLWGCHSLKDDLSQALLSWTHLRSLTVSECHQLTDSFVMDVARHVSSLRHFWLRYCKRITDAGILSIAQNLLRLQSLDLTFCSSVTVASISELLLRISGLSELRLVWCKALDLVHAESGELGRAGQELLRAARRPESHLSVLDVAHCPGSTGRSMEVFAAAMESLGFSHHTDGCFTRSARCTIDDQKRMVEEFCHVDFT